MVELVLISPRGGKLEKHDHFVRCLYRRVAAADFLQSCRRYPSGEFFDRKRIHYFRGRYTDSGVSGGQNLCIFLFKNVSSFERVPIDNCYSSHHRRHHLQHQLECHRAVVKSKDKQKDVGLSLKCLR